jgi:hypothetical protein
MGLPKINRPYTRKNKYRIKASTPWSARWALNFDKVNDHINVPDSDDLSFGNASTDSPFSVFVKHKPTDMNASVLVSKGSSAQREYNFVFSGDNLYFTIFDSNASNRRRVTATQASHGIADGVLSDVFSIYNGNSSHSGMKIIVDGVQVNNGTGSVGGYTAMHNFAQPFLIGRNFADVSQYISGLVYEFAIWNIELSLWQTKAIHERQLKPDDIPGLISWWRIQEGYGVVNGTKIGDFKANNHGNTQGFSGNPSNPWKNVGVNPQ